MRKKFSLVVAISLLALLISCAPQPSSLPAPTQGSSGVPVSSPTANSNLLLQIEATTLYTEYETNAVAADLKYKNKQLQVSGTLTEISTDLSGNPTITFGMTAATFGIIATFDKSKAVDIALLKKGQRITVNGTGEGKLINVMLKNCSIATTATSSTSTTLKVVTFPDAKLLFAIRLAINKPAGDIYQSDLQAINSLRARDQNISNLSGLEYCTNLTLLDLDGNQVSDVSPLAPLARLTDLGLDNNKISDISPLASLTNLSQLRISGNQLINITPLASLTRLTNLSLVKNQINNISPLAPLTNLTLLNLDSNQIKDLSALSSLTHLTNLWLGNNQISDILPLGYLLNLKSIELTNNQISDILPVVYLSKLQGLYLGNNKISNLPAKVYLGKLTSLQDLSLYNNQIIDISALQDMSSVHLDLTGNPLSPNSKNILSGFPFAVYTK